MHIENKGNMKILTPDFGYIIYNKNTDSYSNKVYLGKNASLDNFEEVIDDSIPKTIREKVMDISDKTDMLLDVNDEQDNILNITMMATDEINTEYSYLIDSILVAIDELYCMIESPIDEKKGGDI